MAIVTITINRGATGPAGPNSVTSSTTSDGTATLSAARLTSDAFRLYDSGDTNYGDIIPGTYGSDYTWTMPAGTGTVALTSNADGGITSSDISDATSAATANTVVKRGADKGAAFGPSTFTGTSADIGVTGVGDAAPGVSGSSTSQPGVQGSSSTSYGVFGTTTTGLAGVFGQSGTLAAVYGLSGTGRGVYGTSTSGSGVQGSSTSGTGVYASSVTGTFSAEFVDASTTQLGVERDGGHLRWSFSTYTGRLVRPDLAANRTWTLPEGTGYVALTSQADGSLVSADMSDATADGSTDAEKLLKTTASGGLTLETLTIPSGFSIYGVTLQTQLGYTADRTFNLPNGSGYGALTTSSTGQIVQADVSGLTTSETPQFNGISIVESAVTLFELNSAGDVAIDSDTANSFRTELGVPVTESTIGYVFAYNQGTPAATTIGATSTWYDAVEAATGVTLVDEVDFVATTRGSHIGVEYEGSRTQKFWVTIDLSVVLDSTPSSEDFLEFAIGKNGTPVTGTALGWSAATVSEGALSLSGLVQLTTGDDVTVMVQNLTAADDVVVKKATIIVRPMMTG